MPFFVAINPVSTSASGSGFISTRLRTWSNIKKKVYIKNIYSYGPSYRKSKIPEVTGSLVNLLAGLISVDVFQAESEEHKIFWDMVYSVTSGTGLLLGVKSFSLGSNSLVVSSLNDCLASLECSLKLLADWISVIVKKLSFVELVFLVPSFFVFLSSVSELSILGLESDMALDGALVPPIIPLSVVNDVVPSLSSFKMLTNKIGGLEYVPLNYVKNNAFSGIIDAISMNELLLVVGSLLDGKAAGLSGIPNKL
ncbi:hypothetical protein G9A89_015770 [Geosiphon pyriformis]|nr:hypothetical protein G9A89_015770 [Geosiphon pyriformis]